MSWLQNFLFIFLSVKETEIEDSCGDRTGKMSYFISVKLDMNKIKNTVQGAS